ncbi:MAG: class I SAM-dependent RNA methyltransferase [Candidatus Nanoarchaeia archaeon]
MEPKCKYFRRCGGCSSQHIEYATQVENKRRLLQSCMDHEVAVFFGEPYWYRTRMDMIFHPKGLGFRKKGQWFTTVDIEECPISNERLNALMKEIREFFPNPDAFDVKKHSGTFRYAVMRTPQKDSSISFVLNGDSSRINAAVAQIKKFAKKTAAENVIVTYCPYNRDVSVSDDYFVVKGSDFLKEEYLGKKFVYSVQGFFQNNHQMAERMIAYVHGLLKKYETKDANLLDLYGGVGPFGIICADLFGSVKIVESVESCIDAAKKNIVENRVENAEALVMDAKNLRKVKLDAPLFIITDPPRTGMHQKTIARLNELKPEVMIYVSCNINQLRRELPRFVDYEIKSAVVFDLFPQTPHSEAVVELVRKKEKQVIS